MGTSHTPIPSGEPMPAATAPAASTPEAHEHLLTRPDGRTLAYSHSGPPDSDIVVIWYHGLFSVGDAASPPPPAQQRRAHWVAPTLPGWGGTSPLAPGKTFAETVVTDTLALLRHLRPEADPTGDVAAPLRLFVGGGSFGTVPAQILFGAPLDRFPYGRYLAGMLLVAPFSPFREHKEYAKCLCWRDWVSVGPPTRVVPGKAIPRLMKLAIQGKVRDEASAEAFINAEYFENMGAEEKARHDAWRARRGTQEGEFQRRMAVGMVKSVSKSWEGFLGTADAIHSDWGFKIKELSEEYARRPVIIGVGREDVSMSKMAKFLSESYPNVQVQEYEGGHLSSAWSLDDLLEDMFVAAGVTV